jgi:uncharacterized protein (DUF934 family)
MPKLINRSGLINGGVDHWVEYTGDAHAIPTGSCVILPLAEFREFSGTWINHAKAIGVKLSAADDPALIANDLDKLRLIVIDFPAFTDGRGYSTARLLREKYKWKGELRAVGDVLRDQIFLLSRSGFDSFALRDDQDVQSALDAFNDFSGHYQLAADRFVGNAAPVAFAA